VDAPAEASVTAATASSPLAAPAPSTSGTVPEAGPAKAAALRTVGGSSLTLLDPGQPPRRKLRYAWRIDQKETLALDLRTVASTESAGAKQPDVQFPSVHLSIAIDPQTATPNGDLHYAWRVASTSVDANADTPPEVAEGMRAEVAGVAHLAGSAVVTSCGLTREVAVESGLLGDGEPGGQMAEQVRQTLRDVAAPVPEEEVGVGARWRKLSQLDEKDARVTQTETFKLVDMGEDRGTLDDALAQTAPPQALPALGGSPGTRRRMESMLTSGQEKVRFDLTRLVPHAAFDGTTTMVLSGQSAAGERPRSMRTVMRVFIAIAGSRR
jgi:hypothetical protein